MNGYWQRLKITVRLLPHRFQCQTYVTTFDIGLNVVPQSWPVVLPCKELTGLLDTKMADQQIVAMLADELHPNGFGHKK